MGELGAPLRPPWVAHRGPPISELGSEEAPASVLIGGSAPVSTWSVALGRPSAHSGSSDRLAPAQRSIERLPLPRMELHERAS